MEYYERFWKKEVEQSQLFSTLPVWEEKIFTRLKNEIEPYIQGKVLDVGCGDGTFTSGLKKLNGVKEVLGVDISSTAISKAKAQYADIEFKAVSVTELPFPQESFDFITAVEVAEHIFDVEQMFKEFNRVLRKGGYLLITTTDFNFLKRIIIAVLFWEKYFYPTTPHIRFFTKFGLKDVLQKMGFEIVKYRWNGSYFGIMPKGQIVVARKI